MKHMPLEGGQRLTELHARLSKGSEGVITPLKDASRKLEQAVQFNPAGALGLMFIHRDGGEGGELKHRQKGPALGVNFPVIIINKA